MKSNLKWLLLLLPAVAVGVVTFVIVTQLSGGQSGQDTTSTTKQQSQASQIELSDVQNKINNYQQVLSRTPNDPDVLRILADTYYEMGTLQGDNGQINDSYRSQKSAVDYYRKYLALKPNDSDVMTDLGLAYAELQMVDIAVRELTNAVTLSPTNQRAWHSLGWVQYKWGNDVASARVSWQKSYDLDHNSAIGQESKSFLDQFAGSSNLVLPGSAP